MTEQSFDVVVVGYGPTGMVLAALLGRAGYRVGVVERYPGLYNLPRAACFDDEIMRTFQKLDRTEEVAEGAVPQRDYQWHNADGEILVDLTYDDPGLSGWPQLYMMYQPHLEQVLDATVRGHANVEILQSTRAVAVGQDAAGARIEAVDAGGLGVELEGRFVVAADGGESFVRGALGIGSSSYAFEENWLVCDFHKKRELDVPTFRQICDPAQPTSIVRIGPHHQRFSFMLERDARREEETDPERVWRRVSRYMTPDDAELIRVANYTFRSRIADRWREGRILLAGDAAHEMPPFLAQGMCSGIRDAHNLAWKFGLVLDGLATPALLDTYQPEREPHVRAITEKANELGRVQTLRDPEAARARDAELLRRRAENHEPEKLRFPPYRAGLIADATPGAGELFVQGPVRSDGAEGLFDDVVGHGLVAVTTQPGARGEAGDERLARFARLGGLVAEVGPPGSGAAVEDRDGVYAAWFAHHGADTALVRPDWYVFGTASGPQGLGTLLDDLERRIAA